MARSKPADIKSFITQQLAVFVYTMAFPTQVIKFAPIFDTGTSYVRNVPGVKESASRMIRSDSNNIRSSSHPFQIYIPTNAAAFFYQQIPYSAAYDPVNWPGYYTFPCSSTGSWNLVLEGSYYPVNALDFNLGPTARSVSQPTPEGSVLQCPERFPHLQRLHAMHRWRHWAGLPDERAACDHGRHVHEELVHGL